MIEDTNLPSQPEFYGLFELLAIGCADATVVILSLFVCDPPGIRVLSRLWQWVAVTAELPRLVFMPRGVLGVPVGAAGCSVRFKVSTCHL